MVQQADLDQGQGLLQALGDGAVGGRGVGAAGRVVVTDDHRRRIVAQRPPHHLARVHLGAVDGAGEQFLEGQRAVPGVQEQHREHLVRPCPQAAGEVAAGGDRVGEGVAAGQGRGKVAVAQLQGGGQLAGPGRTQAGQAGQLHRGAVQQRPQRAVAFQQLAAGLHCVAAGQARTQEDRQQFGVRQRPRAAQQQLFTGTLGAGPFADVHGCRVHEPGGDGHQAGRGLGVSWSPRPA